MPPNSHVKDYSFLCIQVILGYLPRKRRFQNWSKFILQVSQLVTELAKVKSMSSLVWLDSRFGRFESVESTFVRPCVDWLSVARLVSCALRSLVFSTLLFCSVTCPSPIIVLSVRSVVLRVASSGNQRSSPQCPSFRLRASSLLQDPGCDETVPQYVSSSHDRLNFEWGVLCSVSRNRWSIRFVISLSFSLLSIIIFFISLSLSLSLSQIMTVPSQINIAEVWVRIQGKK